jgi:hypothetical protein
LAKWLCCLITTVILVGLALLCLYLYSLIEGITMAQLFEGHTHK